MQSNELRGENDFSLKFQCESKQKDNVELQEDGVPQFQRSTVLEQGCFHQKKSFLRRSSESSFRKICFKKKKKSHATSVTKKVHFGNEDRSEVFYEWVRWANFKESKQSPHFCLVEVSFKRQRRCLCLKDGILVKFYLIIIIIIVIYIVNRAAITNAANAATAATVAVAVVDVVVVVVIVVIVVIVVVPQVRSLCKYTRMFLETQKWDKMNRKVKLFSVTLSRKTVVSIIKCQGLVGETRNWEQNLSEIMESHQLLINNVIRVFLMIDGKIDGKRVNRCFRNVSSFSQSFSLCFHIPVEGMTMGRLMDGQLTPH